MSTLPEVCVRCEHKTDAHSIVNASNDVTDGGFIVCPVKGCGCYATWGMKGQPAKNLPDRFEVELIRERIQNGSIE